MLLKCAWPISYGMLASVSSRSVLPTELILGAGVDPGGDQVEFHILITAADYAACGRAALHIGGAGQRRVTDHVSDSIDVLDRRPEAIVDVKLPALVGLQARVLQGQLIRIALAARWPTARYRSSVSCRS